jgi:hypothetical protein
MKFRKLTLDSPEVKAILDGVWKSGTISYYRIIDGKHVAMPIREELIVLGMSHISASRLLQTADLPRQQFIHNKRKAKVPSDTITVAVQEPLAAPAAITIPPIEVAVMLSETLNSPSGSKIYCSANGGKASPAQDWTKTANGGRAGS